MRKLMSILAAAAVLVVLVRVAARSVPGDVPIVSMSPHMDLTAAQQPQPGDQARADAIVATVKRVMAQYQDYRVAEAAGFREMNPNLRIPQKHFTNWAYAREAWSGHFNPEHPTSLLYQTLPDGGFKLVGAMFTASTSASKDELNRDVPLSVAQWHRHVNLCMGPPGAALRDYMPPTARFGFAGSIATRSACDAAGGRFIPQIYGWMVHVWPYQSDPKKVWAHDMNGEDAGAMESMGPMEHHAGETVAFTSLPIALDKLPAADIAPGDSSAGASVFAARCAVCHGAAGRNGSDAPALAGKGIAAGQVAFMVRQPQAVDPHSGMPKLALTDRELADVAAYVASLK